MKSVGRIARSWEVGKKQVKTQAVTPGCYKYDAGGFRSGTIYGMSGGSKAEFVILP
jgi:hypothetical protein